MPGRLPHPGPFLGFVFVHFVRIVPTLLCPFRKPFFVEKGGRFAKTITLVRRGRWSPIPALHPPSGQVCENLPHNGAGVGLAAPVDRSTDGGSCNARQGATAVKGVPAASIPHLGQKFNARIKAGKSPE